MTLETIKALSDSELAQIIAWAQQEQKTRAEKRKKEAIAKIKELAGTVGIPVTIGKQRAQARETASNSNCAQSSDQFLNRSA